jgi:hypothetical protein
MVQEYLYFMLALGAILSILGFIYTLTGTFIVRVPRSSGGGTSHSVKAGPARFFGFLLFLIGLPLIAFGFGATQAPNEAWYLWIHQYITNENYRQWFFGFAVAAIVVHIMASFFISWD